MKNLIKLSLLSLVLTSVYAEAAAPPQPAPDQGYIAFGGFNTTSVIVPPLVVTKDNNPLGWFVLTNNGNPTSNQVTPLRKSGIAYTHATRVTACVGAFGQTSAANSPWQLFYADASFAHDATTASLTNPVYQNGVSLAYPFVWFSLVPSQYSFYFEIPAGKYAGVQISTPSNTGVNTVCRLL